MIRTTKQGRYTVIETYDHTKILSLGAQSFAWVNAGKIGDILVSTNKKFQSLNILSTGTYRIYDVKNEPELTDLTHLELFVGDGTWQGYLLPKGLPNGVKRHRIIPTKEIITKTTH
ncbi:MAG: hypothetical protein KA035_00355 [Candidatus Levybacteria bacterium]|nr:hypothetical protein [Candidatus Levybacteria bacterium]